MYISTPAIVLSKKRYSETSALIRLYTEKAGLVSFIAKGLFGKRRDIRASYFDYLSLVQVDCNLKALRNLQQLREVTVADPLTGIRGNMVKTTLAIFITEVLTRCLQEEEENREMFRFLWQTVQELNTTDRPLQAFHLVFLLKLSRYLGFEPAPEPTGEYFDMQAGVYSDMKPLHGYFMDKEATEALNRLQRTDYTSLDEFTVPKALSDKLLLELLVFYRLHIPVFGELKSVPVLHDVLNQ